MKELKARLDSAKAADKKDYKLMTVIKKEMTEQAEVDAALDIVNRKYEAALAAARHEAAAAARR